MRYSPGRTYSLVLHGDAEADLDCIFEENEDVCAEIEAFSSFTFRIAGADL